MTLIEYRTIKRALSLVANGKSYSEAALAMGPSERKVSKLVTEGVNSVRLRRKPVPKGVIDFSTLTPRRKELLREALKGSKYREISKTLRISEKTVKNTFGLMFVVYGCANKTELVMEYARYLRATGVQQ